MRLWKRKREASGPVSITRVFDAPREIVWKAWTDPDIFRDWWGPEGFTAPSCKMDLRPEGSYLYCMRSPDGKDFWNTGVYREIVPDERLVFTSSFSDEKGTVVPATQYGLSAEFPQEMLVTVVLEGKGGRTRLTLKHDGVPSGKDHEDCQAGWRQSFDKLAQTLEKLCELPRVC